MLPGTCFAEPSDTGQLAALQCFEEGGAGRRYIAVRLSDCRGSVAPGRDGPPGMLGEDPRQFHRAGSKRRMLEHPDGTVPEHGGGVAKSFPKARQRERPDVQAVHRNQNPGRRALPDHRAIARMPRIDDIVGKNDLDLPSRRLLEDCVGRGDQLFGGLHDARFLARVSGQMGQRWPEDGMPSPHLDERR